VRAWADRDRGTTGGNRFQIQSNLNTVSLSSSLEVGRQPFETFVQAISTGRACGLDVPCPLPEAVQSELIGNLCGVHGVGQILLVGEHEEKCITEFVLIEHALELLAGLGHTLTIVRVNNEDDALGVLEVVPPERSDLVLPSDVPDGEGNVLVLDGLDIEADGGDGSDNLAELELV